MSVALQASFQVPPISVSCETVFGDAMFTDFATRTQTILA